MTRTMLFALTASAAVAGTTYLYGQGSSVSLQPSTPGTQQVGHANVSGRVIAGSIQAENSSPTAQVIVGNATSTTGANFGGFFRSDSVLGRALYGRASALSGTTHGVWGQADSPGGRGVTGVAPAASGNATGVWGQTASTTGRGVYGYTTNSGGINYGVFGHTSSPSGYGVYSQGNMHATGVISGNGSGLSNVNASQLGGFASAAYLRSVPVPLSLIGSAPSSGVLVAENSSPASESSGILGKSTGADTAGVRGMSYQGYGVNGVSEGVYGVGVYGLASSSSGITYGGHFRSTSPSGRGLFSETTGTVNVNYGGWFESASSSGRGLYAIAVSSTGFNYGVRGVSMSPDGYGVYSGGNLGASGTKAFRIDHPFDPENKYLLHYAAESPMPQNFYVGNVVTDAQGYAWVALPDYFAEINRNFKYQLTVVGKSFAQAVVWEEVKNNRFQIRTDAPNVKVSWRVDADRNDLYVRNRPPKDVVEKEGADRGTYQHPELYGYGPERGMDYDGERQKPQTPPAMRNR